MATEAVQVNLADMAGIRNCLDDHAAELFSSSFLEDTFVPDAKLGLGLFLCVLAGCAQFYPGEL